MRPWGDCQGGPWSEVRPGHLPERSQRVGHSNQLDVGGCAHAMVTSDRNSGLVDMGYLAVEGIVTNVSDVLVGSIFTVK